MEIFYPLQRMYVQSSNDLLDDTLPWPKRYRDINRNRILTKVFLRIAKYAFPRPRKRYFPGFSISITCCQLYANGSLISRNTRVIYATDCQFRQRRFVRLINRFCPPDKPLWRVSIRPQYHTRVRVLGNSIYALIVLRFLRIVSLL